MNSELYHIIIVEDNPDDAELIQLQLKKCDFTIQCHIAASFKEYKKLLSTIDTDLVISDYNLLDSTAVDLFEYHKKNSTYRPFIIVSGYIGEEKAVEAVKLGIDDYIMKDNLIRMVPTVERLILEAQEKRKSSLWESIFHSVVDSSTIGFILMNSDLEILMVNPFFTELSGFTEDELIGKRKSFLYLQTIDQLWEKELDELLNDDIPKVNHEWVMRIKGDSHLEVQSTIMPICIEGNQGKYYISFITDITESNREDRILKQTEAISGVGGWQYDVINDKVYHTSKSLEIYGLEKSGPPETTAEYFLSFFESDSREQLREYISAAIRDHTSYKDEFNLQSKDGKRKILEISGKPNLINDRTFTLSGTMEDITEEKTQEKELEKLSLVAQKTQNAVIITDEHERIEWVNNAFCKLTGYSAEEVSGKNPGDLLQGPKTDSDTVKRMSDAISKKEGFEEELINYTKSGTPYWIKIDVTPIEDNQGNISQFFAIQEDITERKLAELELAETERKLRNIVENSTNLFYQHDIEGKLTYLSPQSKKFLGISPSETIDQLWTEFVTDNPANLKGKKATQKAIETSETQPAYELELRKKSGDKIWVQVNERPITADGKTVAITGSLTNITDLKNYQDYLIESEARLKEAQRLGNIGDWNFDVKSGEITWSEQMYRIYDRDPALGPPDYDELMEYYPEDSQEIHNDAVNKALNEGQNYTFEVVMLAGKKTPCYIEAQGVVEKNDDGTIDKLYGTVQDITARKRTHLELEFREERLRNVINSVEGVVMRYILKPDGTDAVDYVSDGAEKLWGINAKEATKNISVIWNNIVAEDVKKIQKSIQRSAQTLKIWDDIYRYRINETDIKWIHGRGTPKKEENGDIIWDTVLTDITELKKAEMDNVVLLQEIHHRVKNNLAIISGLLQLEEFETDNEELILPLKRSQNRILSMAKVHEMLYQSKHFSSINIKQYLTDLVGTIRNTMSPGSKVKVDITSEDYQLNVNTAIPLGMLLNELLSNSFKYAFKDSEEGKIHIQLKNIRDNTFKLCYEDSGAGFKDGYNLENTTTLGMTLLKTLLSQLEADYEFDTNGRFYLNFTFKVKSQGAHARVYS